MSDEKEKKRPRREPFRVPGIVVPVLGALVGWFIADLPGAVLGGIIGFFVWKTRS